MSERDKWGRIPATIIEVDQDFCSLTWSEGQCKAGPESNLQIFTRDWPTDDIWTKTGTPTPAFQTPNGFPTYLMDPDTGDFVFVEVADRSQLPVYQESKRLYGSFVYQEAAAGEARISVGLTIVSATSETISVIGFDIYTVDRSTLFVDPEVNDITITDIGGGWYEVTYYIDSEDVTTKAYTVYQEFRVIPNGGNPTTLIRIGESGVSDGIFEGFVETDGEPKLPNPEPCFNTLSTCQNLPNYTVKGSLEALDLINLGTGSLTYEKDLQGSRNEGLFVTFYFRVIGAFDFAGLEPVLSVGSILSCFYRFPSGGSPSLLFSDDGRVISKPLDLADGTTYKIAVFVSKSGTISARGVSQSDQGDAWDTMPDQVEIFRGNDTVGHETYISDLVIYDYQPELLDPSVSSVDVRQKGDRYGDAVFYTKLNKASNLISEDGVTPKNAFSSPVSDPDLVSLSGLEFGTTDKVKLEYYDTEVELLEPPLTLRFSERSKSSRLPETLQTIPSLTGASNKPAQLSVGGTNENISALGSRDELSATFQDHPYSDFLTDPYRDQRTYDPESQGTFWGKWEARNIYRQGFPVRKVSGYELEGGGFERTNVYNYIVEKSEGPSSSGKFTLFGYDILQALRADRAVFPAASNGRLSADITDTATTLTMQPVDVGEEYPDAFRCIIGGEGFDVTRSGDVLTFDGTGSPATQRGLYGGAEDHSEDDTVQVVAQFDAIQIHNIAFDLITTAIPALEGNIPKDKWDSLADDFLPRLYSADITEPTGVEDLLAELTKTAPIYFYADVRTNRIELEVIREPSQVAINLTENAQLIGDSISLKEYPKERIDEVWIYYRIRNAAEDIDDEENYSQRFILVNPQEQDRRGRRSIKRIYTRWIEAGARDTAEEIAQAYISRFQNPPVRVSFDLDARQGDIWLGNVANLVSRQKQDLFGNDRSDLNYQIIQAQESKDGHQFSYVAQSYEFFSPVNPEEITITIQPENTVDQDTGDVKQINLREYYDQTIATEIPNIFFVVAGGPLPAGGANVGANTGQLYSLFLPNDWPWSPNIEVRIEEGGVVAGRGGQGGQGVLITFTGGGGGTLDQNPQPGEVGQTAFEIAYPVTINNLGIIGGGGGGGGGSFAQTNSGFDGGSGGGGAGLLAGPRGPDQPPDSGRYAQIDATAGTLLTGGAGGYLKNTVSGATNFSGGRGGDLGLPGSAGETTNGGVSPGGNGAAGGAAGLAIDGIANVTFKTDAQGNPVRGDIRGNEA